MKDLEESKKKQRPTTRRVNLDRKNPGIPGVKRRVFPFMVDEGWMADDENGLKESWGKLARSNPPGFR